MKSLKTSSLFRLVALLLIAVIVTCMVGFVADGFQGNTDKKPESGETDETDGKTDEKPDGDGKGSTPEPPAIPEFIHPLTGLETTENEMHTKPLCFVMDANAPTYGISEAPLVIELPIENGKTRYLIYRDQSQNLGKIGSITYGRDFITDLTKTFGGIAIFHGTDDTNKDLSQNNASTLFDLSLYNGYAYTENTTFIYSNKDLLLAGLKNTGISTVRSESIQLPFNYVPYYSDPIRYFSIASTVILPYGEGNETTLSYNALTGSYTLLKNGQAVPDLLNGKNVCLDNAFVLFSDTTTYESAERTEMVTDTKSGGKGYYFTNGSVASISWSTNTQGNLVFKNEKGEILNANRGTSYIGFFKSSMSSGVIYS